MFKVRTPNFNRNTLGVQTIKSCTLSICAALHTQHSFINPIMEDLFKKDKVKKRFLLYIPVLLKSAICARKSAHLVASASIILWMRRNIAIKSKQGEDNRDDRGTPLPNSRVVSHWLGNWRRYPLQRSDPLLSPLHG